MNAVGDLYAMEPVDLMAELTPPDLPPYARILRGILQGQMELAVRDDEAEASWSIVEPILRMLLGVWEQTRDLAMWLPGAAGEAITGASLYTSSGIGDLLPWWQGLLVLIGYGLLLAVVGRFTALRRDIT